MKKIFLIAIVLFVGTKVFCQVPYELGATKHDSIYLGTWITGISRDGTLADSSTQKLVTEAAVKRYADSVAAVGALDSIAAHTDTLQSHNTRILANKASLASKQDSLDAHTDSIQSHNTRILANKTSLASKQDSIDAHTDTLQSHNTRINALVNWATDSIAKHTDTLQSHNARLTTLETTGVSGVLTASIQYICTTDATSTSPNSTGYFIGIYDNLNGFNLVKVEALYAESQGDMTLAAYVWRNRANVEVAMTSVGASFSADATINPDYDDVATGDRLEIRWTYTGGTTAADGFMINLTFQKP
jgi:hypothetical protein